MIAIDEMVRQPMAQALGWALLQFLWQGTLIGVLTAALLALLRRSAADVRYVVSTVALALMLTMPVVTAVQTFGALGRGLKTPALQVGSVSLVAPDLPSGPVGRGLQAPPTAAAESISRGLQAGPAAGDPVGRQLPIAPSWPIDQWLPMLLTAWLAGVAMLTLRLLSGWIWVQRMKSHDARPVHEGLETMARRLMRRLHIVRAVRLLESTSVDVPTVIGWLSPVVLLPATVLSGLTPRQVEAILAHELAHVRRHDYLVNLLQAVVETLLFYHPAVWWLSRRIRTERENCCDDLAVSLCGDPVAYAAALAELEGLRSSTRALVLAATGGSLLQRVKRLLGAPSHAGRAPGWLAAGLAVLVLTMLSASAMNTDALMPDRPAETAQIVASTPTPVRSTARSAPPVPIDTGGPAAAAATAAPSRVAAAPQLADAPAEIRDRDGIRAASVAAFTTTPSLPTTAMVATTAAAGTPAAVATTDATAAIAAVAAVVTQTEPVLAAPRTTLGERGGPGHEQSGTYSWSDNGDKFEIDYRGQIEFTADDSDVARISPGGRLRIKDGRRWLNPDTAVELTADGSGNIQRRYWVGWTERPFDPEGRKWLATMLPRFIRQSGIGAPARVARILKSGGVTGVLAEISRVEGSWAKRLYFNELMKSPGLSAADVQRAFAQAGTQIDSDFELASFLVANNRLVADDGARRAYLEAARSIGSDFELRKVLASILKDGPAPSAIAAAVLDVSTSIDSDHEEGSLLTQFVGQQALDGTVRGPFFKALATVGSAFEHAKVLKALLQRTDLPSEARSAVLESTATISSDFEKGAVLQQFVRHNSIEGPVRAPFFRAVGSISSAFERGKILQQVARRSDLSDESTLELLRSAQGVNSSHERAQVLLAVASTQPLSRAGRDAYIDAAEKLGDFEQGRVLSALVKNERRTPAR
jgi:beta-lactamase regulating signal transducer with metallopeptidase domain